MENHLSSLTKGMVPITTVRQPPQTKTCHECHSGRNIWDWEQSKLSETMMAMILSNSKYIYGAHDMPGIILSTSHILTHFIFTATLRSTMIIPVSQLSAQLDNSPQVTGLSSGGTGAPSHRGGSIGQPAGTPPRLWLGLIGEKHDSNWTQAAASRAKLLTSTEWKTVFTRWEKTGFVVSPTFGDLGKVLMRQKPCCSVPSGH